MIKQILPEIFRIEVPLPGNPLKATNSYLIKGRDRNLMIDTGMNRSECKAALEHAFCKLEVEPKRTDLFITHLHADHLGLASFIATDTSKIYFNEPDATSIYRGGFWDFASEAIRKNGFPETILQQAIDNHPAKRYLVVEKLPFTILSEGDKITVGNYRFTCVETPGHTHGHLCLYEEDEKILVSGDHILDDITPNISYLDGAENPLADYLASLEKIKGYDVDLVLPGHRRLIEDCRRRIEELKQHHRARINEVLAALADGPQNAYKVASKMKWDIVSDDWDTFPLMQKWFATGEALAHLRYLEVKGVVKRKTGVDDQIVFTLS